jgi:hypothetical protein
VDEVATATRCGAPIDWSARRELSWIAADVAVATGVDLSVEGVGAKEFARAAERDLPFYRNVAREGASLRPPG